MPHLCAHLRMYCATLVCTPQDVLCHTCVRTSGCTMPHLCAHLRMYYATLVCTPQDVLCHTCVHTSGCTMPHLCAHLRMYYATLVCTPQDVLCHTCVHTSGCTMRSLTSVADIVVRSLQHVQTVWLRELMQSHLSRNDIFWVYFTACQKSEC